MPKTIPQISLAVPCRIKSVAPNKTNRISAETAPHQNPVTIFFGTQF